MSRPGGTPSATYATVTRQYLPAVVLVIGLSVAISAGAPGRRSRVDGRRRRSGRGGRARDRRHRGDRPRDRPPVRTPDARSASRRAPSASAPTAARRSVGSSSVAWRPGLDLCETETDLLTTAQRAMGAATGGAPTELLLASPGRGTFERTISSGDAPPGCAVDDPSGCPATRRGAAQCFSDSDAIDACPWLRGRRQGRLGAVCVPVSITGRALGVLHTIHDIGDVPSPARGRAADDARRPRRCPHRHAPTHRGRDTRERRHARCVINADGRDRSTWSGRRRCAGGARRRRGGQTPPGSLAIMRSPVWEPPRRPRVRRVLRMARWSRTCSAASSDDAGRVGSIADAPEHLVDEQVAEARHLRLVHQHRLHGRAAARDDGAQLRERDVHRVDTEAVLVGVELDGPQTPRVSERQAASVAESQREAVPLRYLAVARVEERIAGRLTVHQDPTRHPEVQPEHRTAISVSRKSCLPRRRAAVSARPVSAARTPPRSEPALQVPGVGRVDGTDRATERALLDERAGLLGLEDLGQLDVRDRAALGSLREACVLPEEAARVAGLLWLPGLASRLEHVAARRAGRSCAPRHR